MTWRIRQRSQASLVHRLDRCALQSIRPSECVASLFLGSSQEIPWAVPRPCREAQLGLAFAVLQSLHPGTSSA